MPHPVDIYVGKRIRMRRTIQGLSQQALGEKSGVTFQQIQKYERGVNRVGSSRLYQFSKILGVPVGYFYEGYEENPKDGGLAYGAAEGSSESFEHDRLSSRETLEMMRAYYRIPNQKVRKRIFDLVKSLAEQPESTSE